jgi:hypothetical protein
MRWHLSLVAMLCLNAAVEAESPPTSDEVLEAVMNLDDPVYRVRALAANTLVSAGKRAVEPLTKVAETGSSEASNQAMKILEEMIRGGNEETMASARDLLHKLAHSKFQVRQHALEILKRNRDRVMDALQKQGAVFQNTAGAFPALYLGKVENLAAVLPFLREFPELDELSILHTKIGDEHFKYLLPLKKLVWLELSHSNIGDESLKHLKTFPDLKSISLANTRITDKGLEQLKELTQLDLLNLGGNKITDAGLAHLTKLTNLTSLALVETQITDAGIARLQGMKKLRDLCLQDTAVTDAALDQLHALKSLRVIAIKETTVPGAQKLREAIPGVEVNRYH